jgi:NAD(P)-dependent dehydrogenase (short-subunit alcohol dehydrogenase family)
MGTAIIWGASGGIGRAVLTKLKSEGFATIAVAREPQKFSPSADFVFEADFSNPVQVEQVVYRISQEVEQIDFWCYAGGDILSAKAAEMNPLEWNRILFANLSGAFFTYRFSQPLMAENAHLFFLGAVSERLRLPGLSVYAAAKAGLEAFVAALGKEERKKRITIVRPGAVQTELWEKIPMRLPVDAASPEKVALKIWEAYQTDHKGQLDLV